MKSKRKKTRFKFGKTSSPAGKDGEKGNMCATQSTHAESLTSNTKHAQECPNISHRFMTPQDLENELGLSITQQYKLRSARFREKNAKKGGFNLPYIKQMGVIVYDRDDVIKWLNLNKKN